LVVLGGYQPARTTTNPQAAVVVVVVIRADSNTVAGFYAIAIYLAMPLFA